MAAIAPHAPMRSVSNIMKSIRPYVWLYAALAIALPAAAQQEEMINGRRAVANEALVKFRDSGSVRLRAALAREHNIRFSRGLGSSGVVQMNSATESAQSMIQRLSLEPDVLYAEPDYIVYAVGALPSTGPDDALFPEQWDMQNIGQSGGVAHADIDAPAAWAITTGSRATVVGVVDTGVDYTHPDLAPNIWTAPSSFTITFGPGDSITCPAGSHGYDAIRNVCDPMDQNSHGTHVSGTIGAVGNNRTGIAGINWTASILGLRFMDASGQGTVANAIRAIDFAIQLRSVLPAAANVRVLSNSWEAAGPSQSLLAAINAANSAGILFVVAAGNDSRNLDTTPAYPASYRLPNEISVAATDSKDALASFSNYGVESVDLGAPGVSILSTVMGGQYAFWDGTSMATPHVSGAAALVLSVCPESTAALRQTILDNVDPDPALASKTVTGGRLNIYRAVRSCALTPGFTVSAMPAALTVAAGSSVTAVISVSSSSNVTLAASGLPAGVTATFTPAAASSMTPSLLTLTTSATALPRTATVTVTGSGAGTSSTTSVSVTVIAPSAFTLSATPASLAVPAGSSVTTVIGIAATGGFKGNVALSATGLPAGVTASFLPASIAPGGSSILTLTAAALAGSNTALVTISGASGQMIHTAAISVTVVAAAPAVRLSVWPASLTLAAGSWATSSVAVSGSGRVTLSVTGLPPGVTAVLSPASVAAGGTATLTITASRSVASCTTWLAITVAGSASASKTGLTLNLVAAPTATFKVNASPNVLTVTTGSSASSTVTITPSGGFTGAVALTASGLPAGVTTVFSPAIISAGRTATLTLAATATSAPVTTMVTITGASGTLSNTTTLQLSMIRPRR